MYFFFDFVYFMAYPCIIAMFISKKSTAETKAYKGFKAKRATKEMVSIYLQNKKLKIFRQK